MNFSRKHIAMYVFIALIGLMSSSIFFNPLKFLHDKNSFFNGEYASAIEKDVARQFPFRDLSVSFWKYIKFQFFNEGLQGVVLGRDGGLFTAEEFEYYPNADLNFLENKNYIFKTYKKFKDKGVQLLVVPIPSKARIYNQYASDKYPSYNEGLYSAFLDFLNQKNIGYIDLESAYKNIEALYYKTDTHWTAKASEIAAVEVGKLNIIRKGSQNFETIQNGEKRFEGDLTKYVWSQNYPAEIYSDFDEVSKNINTHGLFDDQYFPTVLVGTSYSADKRWGFENFLKIYLKQDVLNMADKGLGPFKVMKRYVDNLSDVQKLPKYVIWEIPERYLTKEILHDE